MISDKLESKSEAKPQKFLDIRITNLSYTLQVIWSTAFFKLRRNDITCIFPCFTTPHSNNHTKTLSRLMQRIFDLVVQAQFQNISSFPNSLYNLGKVSFPLLSLRSSFQQERLQASNSHSISESVVLFIGFNQVPQGEKFNIFLHLPEIIKTSNSSNLCSILL